MTVTPSARLRAYVTAGSVGLIGGLAVGDPAPALIGTVLLVLGVVAYIRPVDVGVRMHVVDLVGLVGITLLGVLTLRGSRRVTRFEGAILVAAYVGFLIAASIL